MTQPLTHILITGASSGIGAALARGYAAPGRTLSLLGRNQQRLDEIAQVCRKCGADVITIALDVRESDKLVDWINERDAALPLDLVIANAGISGGTGLQNEPLDQAQKIFEINVIGVANTIDPALRRMQQRNHGQLAVVSSLAAFCGVPNAPAYSASKAAVKNYAAALRGTLNNSSVTLHTIYPGFIETPLTAPNPFPMPFIMSADKAAKIVIDALHRGKNHIAFPWPMTMLAQLQQFIPEVLRNKIYQRVPPKPQIDKQL